MFCFHNINGIERNYHIVLLYYDNNYYSYQMFFFLSDISDLKIDLFLKCNKHCCNIKLNTSILYIELHYFLWYIYLRKYDS